MDDAKKHNAIKNLLKLTREWDAYKSSVGHSFFLFRRRYTKISEEDFEKVAADRGIERLIDIIISVYGIFLSEEDIKGLVEFYSSKLGEKLRNPKLLERLARSTLDWAIALDKDLAALNKLSRGEQHAPNNS